MMPIGQFGVDGCHLDGGRAQYGLGDHQGGRQGGGTGVALKHQRGFFSTQCGSSHFHVFF